MEQADNTLIRNASIDPAHPRWAFVPRLGACAWCVFLGSQGFMYHSQSTVSASRHRHCKCSSVVDFDTRNPSLKGYNQAAMQDAYKKCRDAVIDDIDSTWAAMSKEEIEAYARTHNIRKGHSVFDVYQRNRIIQEMKTRDREWLRTGKAAKVDTSLLDKVQYDRLEDYEKKTWDWLAENHGLGFTLLPEDPSKPANIDALYQGALWELKNPKQGKHAIEDRIREGCKKWKRLSLKSSPKIIICNSESNRSDKEVLEESVRRCKWYGADELIFLSHDGTKLYRWAK